MSNTKSINELIKRLQVLLQNLFVDDIIIPQMGIQNTDSRQENFNNTLPIALFAYTHTKTLQETFDTKSIIVTSMVLRNIFELASYIRVIKDEPHLGQSYYDYHNFDVKVERILKEYRETSDRDKKTDELTKIKELYPNFIKIENNGSFKKVNWYQKRSFKALVESLQLKYPDEYFNYDEYFAATSKFVHPTSGSLNFYLNSEKILQYEISTKYSEFVFMGLCIHLIKFGCDYRKIFKRDCEVYLKEIKELTGDFLGAAKEANQNIKEV